MSVTWTLDEFTGTSIKISSITQRIKHGSYLSNDILHGGSQKMLMLSLRSSTPLMAY
ncbi:hypothetical protein [Algibacillus agarilyticus]|uniref:hypothetical protein n=1 Tax=Algibacillus agarilyticus TaxID=2234133 RepID=UPI0013005AA7|nr:hypothetical protein [Algibacillus agarilyticus]